MTVLGGLGLILSGFLFFWDPSVDIEEFQLGAGHQVAYASCQAVGADYEVDYFGDVTVDESCACYARHWAHDFASDYQADIKTGLKYMYDYYEQVDWSQDADVEAVDRKMVAEYANMSGKLNMPKRTPDIMRRQMTHLAKVTETYTDFDSFIGTNLEAMIALDVKEPVFAAPENEADVVIALRGSSDAPHLSASN